MGTSYAGKTAARLLTVATGTSYQRALTAIRDGNLAPLLTEPSTGPADEMLNLVGVHLASAGQYSTLADARRALLVSTLAAVVRGTYPTAAWATVGLDEEAPLVGSVVGVRLDDDTEVDVTGEPIVDEAFAWAHLLACALHLGAGESTEVQLPAQ